MVTADEIIINKSAINKATYYLKPRSLYAMENDLLIAFKFITEAINRMDWVKVI